MGILKLKTEIKTAFKVGFVCIFTYLVSYILRNVLSVLTPQMIETNLFNREFIALLSSVYFAVYAGGQLVNGFIGDYLKPKYMVSMGLILSGAAFMAFPFIGASVISVICFGVSGFGMSMLRGPLVKVISENTESKYARICCVFLSFSSFAGPLIAGIFALFFKWDKVFILSGIISVLMAIFSFSMLSIFENKNIIVHREKTEKKKSGIKEIFKVFTLDNFIVYMLLCMIIEIAGVAISFWIPTYLNEYLGFSPKVSGMIFSAMTFIKAFSPFISLVLFKIFKENDMFMMRVMFLIATVIYVMMCVISNIWLNMILFVLANISVGCASTTVWSIYVPSLGKSGKVSSANGVLDCSGYAAASITSVIFAGTIESLGWKALILVWSGIMFMGAIITFFTRKNKNEG